MSLAILTEAALVINQNGNWIGWVCKGSFGVSRSKPSSQQYLDVTKSGIMNEQ